MEEIFDRLSLCVEIGKLGKDSIYPKNMVGQDGAIELTREALNRNISPADILNKGMLPGMKRVGEKFKDGKIFLPEVLISAKAMNGAMELLKPYFVNGEVKLKGKVILATVQGDLHDIGKNIVRMILEGGGWEVIDLGVNVDLSKIITAINNNSCRIVGLSALLTTTMQNMRSIVKGLKQEYLDIKIILGGAPVTSEFAFSIGADEYFSDPQGMLDYINNNAA